MFCRMVVPVFFSFVLTEFSVAQETSHQSQEPTLHETIAQPQTRSPDRAPGVPSARISVTRLRVPHRARRLYEQAITAWLRHDPVEANNRLQSALKIDPEFPEALTLSAFMRATHHQWDDAEQSLQSAIQSDPGYTPALWRESTTHNYVSMMRSALPNRRSQQEPRNGPSSTRSPGLSSAREDMNARSR